MGLIMKKKSPVLILLLALAAAVAARWRGGIFLRRRICPKVLRAAMAGWK
jgi:hypothetical protein